MKSGKSVAPTTRLVDRGVYGLVRHPQYLGGILALFVTTLLWYPHWLFGLLGAMGIITIYMGTVKEEERLVGKFGEDYEIYMDKVPRLNIVAGIIRQVRFKDVNPVKK